jgi:D-aspartate ligase
LQSVYERVSKANCEILMQEWIPGDSDQIVVWGGYMSKASEPLAYFTARKIVQEPSEFGTGCVVESTPLPELLEPSVRLCRALGYQGLAEIEYKREVRNGTLKLIEINPRHWDWHQLGDASHVNLTWAAYRHLAGETVEPVQPRIQHATWIAEDALLTHALAGMCQGEFGAFKALRRFSRHTMCSIFSMADPLPFFRYTGSTLLPSLVRAAGRKIYKRIVGRAPAIPTGEPLSPSVSSEDVAISIRSVQPDYRGH